MSASSRTFLPSWAAQSRTAPAGPEKDPENAEAGATGATGTTGATGATGGQSRKGRFLPPWADGGLTRSAEDSPTETMRTRTRGGQTRVPGQIRPLLVRGGLCALPGRGFVRVDLLLENGRIRAIGEGLDAGAADVVEAGGRQVIPGLVDPHVHAGIFSSFESELRSETRSALLNGVTSIGLYAGTTGSYLRSLDSTISRIGELSHVDVFLHLPIFTREQLEEIPLCASRYGITSFKAYMCGIKGLIPAADDAFLMDIMTAVADLGPGAILNIHAENADLVERAAAAGLARRPAGLDPAGWAAARPSYVEEEAVRRAAFLAKTAGARIYFVHLSSAAAASAVRILKREGADILAETTSPYLTLDPGQSGDSRSLMVPPVRGGNDREGLWAALADGTIDSIGTDHTPLLAAMKRLRGKAPDTLPGYPAVGTHLPSLYDEALRRDFPIDELVDRVSTRPAAIFGVGRRKGAIAPGADADLVIIDPESAQKVTTERAASFSDFALHEGESLVGWPELVIKGGIPVSAGDPPRGEYLGRFSEAGFHRGSTSHRN